MSRTHVFRFRVLAGAHRGAREGGGALVLAWTLPLPRQAMSSSQSAGAPSTARTRTPRGGEASVPSSELKLKVVSSGVSGLSSSRSGASASGKRSARGPNKTPRGSSSSNPLGNQRRASQQQATGLPTTPRSRVAAAAKEATLNLEKWREKKAHKGAPRGRSGSFRKAASSGAASSEPASSAAPPAATLAAPPAEPPAAAPADAGNGLEVKPPEVDPDGFITVGAKTKRRRSQKSRRKLRISEQSSSIWKMHTKRWICWEMATRPK